MRVAGAGHSPKPPWGRVGYRGGRGWLPGPAERGEPVRWAWRGGERGGRYQRGDGRSKKRDWLSRLSFGGCEWKGLQLQRRVPAAAHLDAGLSEKLQQQIPAARACKRCGGAGV